MPDLLPSLTSNPARETARETVLFAFNDGPDAIFRPLFDPADLPPMDHHWVNLSSVNQEAWTDLLLQTKPTVLVTGWLARSIPEAFYRSPDFSLKYVCHLMGEVRSFIPRQSIERGLLVSNWGTAISHTIAEHAILLALGALRCLPAWESHLHAKWWQRKAIPTRSLRGKRVGVHGFGAIGREVLGMLKGFGAQRGVYSQGVPAHLIEAAGAQCFASLEEMFAWSDIVIECEALSPANYQSVTDSALEKLRPDSIFVNVGRGKIVDEEALVRIATQRGIRLALDVFHTEPLPPEAALRHVPNAILSPHIAGPTQDAFPLLWEHALRNLHKYYLGEEIDGRVTLDVFDRST
jgi:phosphoglycerate dehydrogenase-like enzyme